MSEAADYKYRLDEAVKTAYSASSLTNNKLYQAAWALMDEAMYDAFRSCDPANIDELQRIRLMVSAANSVRSHFESLITSGKMARLELEEIEVESENETIN